MPDNIDDIGTAAAFSRPPRAHAWRTSRTIGNFSGAAQAAASAAQKRHTRDIDGDALERERHARRTPSTTAFSPSSSISPARRQVPRFAPPHVAGASFPHFVDISRSAVEPFRQQHARHRCRRTGNSARQGHDMLPKSPAAAERCAPTQRLPPAARSFRASCCYFSKSF